jgi:two-component system invasion response regulator UvrY
MNEWSKFIRIVIVDDHAVVREGYRRLLERCLDFRLVGEANDAEMLFRLLAGHPVDVVVMDISLPSSSGIEITRKLRSDYPKVHVLISSMYEEPVFARRALDAGALGYVTKSDEPETLIAAIRQVASGSRYLSPLVARSLTANGSQEHPVGELSAKEFEILRRIVSGESLEFIASSMNLSPKTVANYQSAIKQKLKVTTNAQLFHVAAKNGLIAPVQE